MNTFWILALIIGLIATVAIVVPMLHAHFVKGAKDTSPGATIGIGIAVALSVPISAVILYNNWTSWDWNASQAQAQQEDMAHSMQEAIVGLESRLAREPDNVAGWQMLGRSYASINQFDKAAEAYLKVVELTNGDADARADHAEALAMSDPAGLNGEAGDIFRELVKSAPGNPKVLWYGGLVAFESGDVAEGRRLWTQILELNPPDSLRQIVEQRLAETDPSGAPPTTPEAAPAMAQSPAVEAENTESSAAAGDAISVSISLSPQLTNRLAANMPLFVFARGAGGGPPLAVVRRSTGELPIAMTLSDDNAMMAGVSLSDHDTLQLVARVAMSGSPAAQPGDLFGEVSYSRSDGSSTTIVIDQVVP